MDRRRVASDATAQPRGWHAMAAVAVVNAGRALRLRAASLMAVAHAHTRDKRQPRTSS
jgi:hypothetical protein